MLGSARGSDDRRHSCGEGFRIPAVGLRVFRHPPDRGRRPAADAPSLALTPDAILNPMSSQDPAHGSLRPGRATLEAAQLLGGPMRLRPAAPSPHWKRAILWTILLLGVGMLALMASRLSKALG